MRDDGWRGGAAFELIDDVPDDAENVTIEEVTQAWVTPDADGSGHGTSGDETGGSDSEHLF